jgi:PPOX class probable F420-dependent enzyme
MPHTSDASVVVCGSGTLTGQRRMVPDQSTPLASRTVTYARAMAIPLPADVRELLDRPNYVHLATLRRDGSPRSWVVWAGVEDERILICTDTSTWKARDMQRDPRVSLSVVDLDNPYLMAAIQGRVVEMRPDPANTFMDVLSHKYTGKPFPHHAPNRVCFMIDVEHAGRRALSFEHRPNR